MSRRFQRRSAEDESVESIEDRMRNFIPVRERDDGPVVYRPIPKPEESNPNNRQAPRALPGVNHGAPVFTPHSDWEPVFRDEKGNPVRIPRAVTNAAERERFTRNAQSLRYAWVFDQGWIWQLVFIFVILGLTIWIIVANWSWPTAIVIAIGIAGLVWYAKKHGAW